jgi:hypothetical protein
MMSVTFSPFSQAEARQLIGWKDGFFQRKCFFSDGTETTVDRGSNCLVQFDFLRALTQPATPKPPPRATKLIDQNKTNKILLCVYEGEDYVFLPLTEKCPAVRPLDK